MPTELYLLLGAVIGAVVAYITAKVTSRTQLEIARLQADKDIKLQQDRINDDRQRNELAIERTKLDVFHRTLSRIALENSQTMSYMQSSEKLAVELFRARYLENCDRLHEAMAIADIYYPAMSQMLREIYGQSNVFWGVQESVLRTDIGKNHDGWMAHFSEAKKAGDEIGARTRELKGLVADRAAELARKAPHLQ